MFFGGRGGAEQSGGGGGGGDIFLVTIRRMRDYVGTRGTRAKGGGFGLA